jgi:hypothetical protein
MIALLVWILVLVLVFGVILYVIRLLPLPPPFGNIALAVVALIFILIIISMLLGGVPLAPIRLQ